MATSADNIATFVEVVRQQSLSGAGKRLGLPKSTISRRLARLEQELSAKLMHRGARRLVLTSEGKRFYESVVAAVDALDGAVVDLTQSSREPRGLVRFTAPSDLGRMLLSAMLVAFSERYLEITLDLVFTNRIVDLVQEGVDLAVRAGRVTHSDLIASKLCDSELHLAVASKRKAGGVELKNLEQESFVLHRASGGVQAIRLERGVGARRQSIDLRVTGGINADDYGVLAELVASGQGIGLLPALHVQEGVAAGRLKRLFPEWSARASPVYLVYPSRQQPERVRLLAEFLREQFSRLHHV